MAKNIKKTTTVLHFSAEKGHSVLYKAADSGDSDVVATNIYVHKSVFEGSGGYPAKVTVTIEATA